MNINNFTNKKPNLQKGTQVKENHSKRFITFRIFFWCFVYKIKAIRLQIVIFAHLRISVDTIPKAFLSYAEPSLTLFLTPHPMAPFAKTVTLRA